MMNPIHELKIKGLKVKTLKDSDLEELQTFLSLFQDFFLLCEGEVGSAEGILKSCPPSKDPLKDKFVLGFYENDQLMGLLDLIQNYPENAVLSIGYLLVHPACRSQKKGQTIIENLVISTRKQGVRKLRCVVQKQNPRALKFWKSCGFDIVETKKQSLGFNDNDVDILEKLI